MRHTLDQRLTDFVLSRVTPLGNPRRKPTIAAVTLHSALTADADAETRKDIARRQATAPRQ